MPNKNSLLVTLIAIFCISANPLLAQNSKVTWSSFDMGFGVSSGSQSSVTSLVGQSFVGTSSSSNTAIISGWFEGMGRYLGVDKDEALPIEYRLHQNYPNPFNPTTTIRYQLPVNSRVILRVYNLLGQVVATLVDGEQDAGSKTVVWNSGNMASGISASGGYASGVYFYRLDATSIADPTQTFSSVMKMMFVK